MKKIYTLILATFLITACTKDDNKEDESSIVGSWTMQESKLNGDPVSSQNIVKFTSDSKTEFIYNDLTETGTWNKSNNTLTISWDDADEGLGTYVLEIQELTDTTLKWETEIEGEGTLRETFTR
ncbi:lipocalin family protein [Salegentibacter sp. Hel_I_6]|uniref:lipocalin family protein n=1 Tax=Salegentibacter sp. Hel_I_6 TaxID=1250278 RepID=UPI0005697A88|nr:lipocalin family protein [Salegentibacter sp. Hel_I_6]